MPQPHRPSQAERAAQLLLHAIPAEIRKSLDSTELNDRVREMLRLSAQAQDPVLSAPLRQAAKMRARAVAEAQPRAVTERQHRELIAKAATAPSTAQADAIRRQARELIEERNPVAPRVTATAAVAKAAAARAVRQAATARPAGKPVLVYDSRLRPAGLVSKTAIRKSSKGTKAPIQPVFDQDGNLLGVVDPAAIQPVTGHAKPAPAKAPAQPAQSKTVPTATDTVEDWQARQPVTQQSAVAKADAAYAAWRTAVHAAGRAPAGRTGRR